MKNKFVLTLIISITFLSMTYKVLEPVKCFVGGNNISFDVHLKINGVIIKKGNVGNLKIMNKNHPLKERLDNIPSFLRDELAFVLKEGKNDIELEFKREGGSYEKNGQFTFSLTRSSLNIPIYYFSSKKDSGKITSKFYIQDKKLKKNYTSLGNTDAAFIDWIGGKGIGIIVFNIKWDSNPNPLVGEANSPVRRAVARSRGNKRKL